MAFIRSTHLVGAFLLFVATVLLVITDIAAPVVSNIAIFKVDINLGESTRSVYYGTFGYCTNGASIECTPSAIGYSPSEPVMKVLPSDAQFNPSDADQMQGDTNAMALHPVATALNFIAFLLALRQGVVISLLASLTATLAFVLTVVAVGMDAAWFDLLQNDLSNVSQASAHLSTGFGTLVAAFVCSLLGAIIVLFTCCTHRRKRKALKHHGGETVTTTTTTTVHKGADVHVHPHQHGRHKRHRRCFFCC